MTAWRCDCENCTKAHTAAEEERKRCNEAIAALHDMAKRAEKAERERDAALSERAAALKTLKKYQVAQYDENGQELPHPAILAARLDELRKVVDRLLVKP